MKKKKRRKYKIKNILALVIILILFINLISVFNNSQGKSKKEINLKEESISYLNKIKKSDNFDGNVDKKIENVIIKYMDTYFKSISTLKEIDMTNLFSNDSFEEAYINQTAISLLINSRKLERNKMTINNAKYDIIYDNIVEDGDLVTIKFLENDYFHFDFMKNIESKAYGVENTFVLEKIDNDYKIKQIRKVQDFYVMVTNSYEVGKSKKEAKKELDEMKENYITDMEDMIDEFKIYLKRYENNKDTFDKKCDHKYDRKKALEYAKKYITTRNEKWMNYSEVGGNCQNFASQVIYSGGVPMDVSGNMIWKHYSDVLDETKNKVGRSTSWTTVPYFYNYAKENEGYVLCSLVDVNPFYAEAGDIGQVGYDGEFRHTVVIIGKIKGKNGKIADLLINSNSLNLENYPLSGYVYPDKRIIKILGWNEN